MINIDFGERNILIPTNLGQVARIYDDLLEYPPILQMCRHYPVPIPVSGWYLK